jgi:hypothetical protein
MSTLQPRVRRGRRSALRKRENALVKTLNFHDSDGEFSPDGGSSPFHSSSSIETFDEHSDYLEVDISTPYLNSTSRSARSFISSRKLSPIPFGLDEENDGDVDDDEQRVPAPGKHVISPDSCPLSPPSRKLRALRLFDTPHTPKSLLQKARRRRLTDEKKNGDKVEANINPFTPCNNRPLSCSVSSIKRSREQMEK